MEVQSWHKVAMALVAVAALAGCGRVADLGAITASGYALNYTVVEGEDRRIPCVVARGPAETGGLAISCDWSTVAP